MKLKDTRKRRKFVASHTKQQLVAVAVQKEQFTYLVAKSLSHEELVNSLVHVKGLFTPVPA